MESKDPHTWEHALTQILLIDDDIELCRLLSEYLALEGFLVTMAHDGLRGVELALGQRWAAVVLDVMLPGLGGLEVLRRIRRQSSAPVLMLTARVEDADTVVGLELGADDYVGKPCNPRVLVARLRVLLRGKGGSSPLGESLAVGDLELNPATRQVRAGGVLVELTGAEFNLLAVLLREAGRVVEKETLAIEGLGRRLQPFDRRIEVHMTQIRRKLGPLPDGQPRIQTVRGAGYQYVLL